MTQTPLFEVADVIAKPVPPPKLIGWVLVNQAGNLFVNKIYRTPGYAKAAYPHHIRYCDVKPVYLEPMQNA